MLLRIKENINSKNQEIIITQAAYFQLYPSILRLYSFLNFIFYFKVSKYINLIGFISFNI